MHCPCWGQSCGAASGARGTLGCGAEGSTGATVGGAGTSVLTCVVIAELAGGHILYHTGCCIWNRCCWCSNSSHRCRAVDNMSLGWIVYPTAACLENGSPERGGWVPPVEGGLCTGLNPIVGSVLSPTVEVFCCPVSEGEDLSRALNVNLLCSGCPLLGAGCPGGCTC